MWGDLEDYKAKARPKQGVHAAFKCSHSDIRYTKQPVFWQRASSKRKTHGYAVQSCYVLRMKVKIQAVSMSNVHITALTELPRQLKFSAEVDYTAALKTQAASW